LLFAKVREGIDHAAACLFEISDNTRANVFLELGYAYGRGKRCVLICRRGTAIPTDLKGLELLEYESYKDLSQQLHATIGHRLGGIPVSKEVIVVLATLAPTALMRRADLFTEAMRRGLSEDELRTTLTELDRMGVIAVSEETIEVRERDTLSSWASLAAQ
jgi:hypothetical protein